MKRFFPFVAVFIPLAACSQPDEGATTDAQRTAPGDHLGYYAAKARSAEFPTPDTGSDGRFQVEQGCLIFVSDQGARYLPIFPIDTRFEPAAGGGPVAVVKGSEIHLQRSYTVKGGGSEYRLASPPPPECPVDQFLVGGLL
jgi:hypothetical protein